MTSITFTTEWTSRRQGDRQIHVLEYDLYNGLKVPSIFYGINDDIHDAVHQSECLLSLWSEGRFTILLLSAALVPLVADDTGGPQQQGQCQAHEADPAQHAGQ